jgi:hypothetical protein
LIDPDPTSLRHADDTLASLDSDNPPKLPPGTEVKWIDQPGEHEDTPGQMLATQSHAVISSWAEPRRAKPALLKVADRSDPIQALRFQSSRRREGAYELIPWNEWFDLFDGANLVFIFQERSESGDASDLFQLAPIESVQRQA